MRSLTIPSRSPQGAPARDGPVASVLRPVGRFAAHYLEMCAVMCAGGIGLSLLFFGGAALLGFTNLPDQAPVLSAVVVAVALSLPMAAWMRFRGMPSQPTVEMAGATMLVGLTLIVGYGLDLVGHSSLIEVQARLACPVMLAVMLARFRLYARPHSHAHPK
jgi:hypothetical protein